MSQLLNFLDQKRNIFSGDQLQLKPLINGLSLLAHIDVNKCKYFDIFVLMSFQGHLIKKCFDTELFMDAYFEM